MDIEYILVSILYLFSSSLIVTAIQELLNKLLDCSWGIQSDHWRVGVRVRRKSVGCFHKICNI